MLVGLDDIERSGQARVQMLWQNMALTDQLKVGVTDIQESCLWPMVSWLRAQQIIDRDRW